MRSGKGDPCWAIVSDDTMRNQRRDRAARVARIFRVWGGRRWEDLSFGDDSRAESLDQFSRLFSFKKCIVFAVVTDPEPNQVILILYCSCSIVNSDPS
jgi:hypothetical protein